MIIVANHKIYRDQFYKEHDQLVNHQNYPRNLNISQDDAVEFEGGSKTNKVLPYKDISASPAGFYDNKDLMHRIF